MKAITKLNAEWQEDGTAVILARVTADDATGEATGVYGEGSWLKQADLISIGCKVFDVSPNYATPDTAIATPSVTVSDVIFDTPQTSRTLWGDPGDTVGWNFKLRLAATNFPTGGHVYRVEVLFTLTSGTQFWIAAEGPAAPRRGG